MKKIAEYVPPKFRYTGPLRPWYVSPPGIIPESIPKPDYYMSGIPVSEQSSKARKTIAIYSPKEIEGIRAACKIGRGALDAAGRAIRAGVTPEELDQIVHKYIVEHGAYPSPYNYYNFPKSVCISVNEVICHGIPDHRPLEDGDIVNVDVSAYYKGFHGDLNETFCVGAVDYASKKLIKTSYDSLFAAIATVRPGTLFRDFGNVITEVANKAGFSVVKAYCGHGIGSFFHCPPDIPHYERNKIAGTCQAGMVFTIEPMINAGSWKDDTWPDEWTSVTVDGKRSAQFEHTMLVTEDGVELLTGRTAESAKLWWELEENAADLARYEAEMKR
jgi:methionyl aminopeptidase